MLDRFEGCEVVLNGSSLAISIFPLVHLGISTTKLITCLSASSG